PAGSQPGPIRPRGVRKSRISEDLPGNGSACLRIKPRRRLYPSGETGVSWASAEHKQSSSFVVSRAEERYSVSIRQNLSGGRKPAQEVFAAERPWLPTNEKKPPPFLS